VRCDIYRIPFSDTKQHLFRLPKFRSIKTLFAVLRIVDVPPHSLDSSEEEEIVLAIGRPSGPIIAAATINGFCWVNLLRAEEIFSIDNFYHYKFLQL